MFRRILTGLAVWQLVGMLGMGGCLSATMGCSVLLEGGATVSMGMRNDNFLVLKHTVDGDKEGKVAKSTLDVDALADLIVELREPNADAPVETPEP